MNREEKIKAIYERISDKTVSDECIDFIFDLIK